MALLAEFSVVWVIALDPDLVVLSAYAADNPGLMGHSQVIEWLEAAGIPVIAIDFFTSPLANTETRLRILGAVTGEAERAG